MNDIKNVELKNDVDASGNPSGGGAKGIGLQIDWQKGPLGRGADRVGANGAFVETVIDVLVQRLSFFQEAANGKFKCKENACAITHLQEALHWLDARTKNREAREVEGTHTA